MSRDILSVLTGEVLEENVNLTLKELSRACQAPDEEVIALVEEGIIEPRGTEQMRWRFEGVSIRRARCAIRLQRGLGVNLAGAALAIDLLEELEEIRARLRRFDDSSL